MVIGNPNNRNDPALRDSANRPLHENQQNAANLNDVEQQPPHQPSDRQDHDFAKILRDFIEGNSEPKHVERTHQSVPWVPHVQSCPTSHPFVRPPPPTKSQLGAGSLPTRLIAPDVLFRAPKWPAPTTPTMGELEKYFCDLQLKHIPNMFVSISKTLREINDMDHENADIVCQMDGILKPTGLAEILSSQPASGTLQQGGSDSNQQAAGCKITVDVTPPEQQAPNDQIRSILKDCLDKLKWEDRSTFMPSFRSEPSGISSSNLHATPRHPKPPIQKRFPLAKQIEELYFEQLKVICLLYAITEKLKKFTKTRQEKANLLERKYHKLDSNLDITPPPIVLLEGDDESSGEPQQQDQDPKLSLDRSLQQLPSNNSLNSDNQCATKRKKELADIFRNLQLAHFVIHRRINEKFAPLDHKLKAVGGAMDEINKVLQFD